MNAVLSPDSGHFSKKNTKAPIQEIKKQTLQVFNLYRTRLNMRLVLITAIWMFMIIFPLMILNRLQLL